MTALSALIDTANSTETLPAGLTSFRNEGAQSLDGVLIPTRKTEDWKYSSRRLADIDGLSTLYTATEESAPACALEAIELRIQNGQWKPQVSSVEGLNFKSFADLSEAEVSEVTSGVIAQSKDLSLSQLNHANFRDGLFIEVSKGVQVEQALRIILQHAGEGISYPRVFVKLNDNASLTLIEDNLISHSETGICFFNAVVDCQVAANARLTYLRSDMQRSMQSKKLCATGVALHRDAYFESHMLALGAGMGRHDLRVHMLEPGAECDLNAVCVTKDKEHYDNHTSIEHIAPHCTSNENYRCIADGSSQIVFNGRIHIHRDAQKTLGSMNNRNLLLSSGAEIDSKPELEIYADDVKCAHGCTIGQLNEKEVYYLKTRGVSEKVARQMLTLGFVLEIVRANPNQNLAEFWENTLAEQLSFEELA